MTTKYSIKEIESHRLNVANCSSSVLEQMLKDAKMHYENGSATKQWYDAVFVSFTPYIK